MHVSILTRRHVAGYGNEMVGVGMDVGSREIARCRYAGRVADVLG